MASKRKRIRRRARLRAAKQLRAKPKATAQDYSELAKSVIDSTLENPLIPKDLDPAIPQYDKESTRFKGQMNQYTKGMSPDRMQEYLYDRQWTDDNPMKSGSFKVKDVEKKRMKHLLGTRSEDEAAMLEFQKLRKDLKLPEKVNYGPSTAFDDLYESGMSYAHTGPERSGFFGIKEDPKTFKIRRADAYYPGREADLMAHEVGHVMEGADINKAKPRLPVNIQRRLHFAKKQKDIDEDALDNLFKEPLSSRPERNQRLYGPIKMAISKVYGTVPVNRAEYEVMRRQLMDPSKKKRVIDNALIITGPKGLRKPYQKIYLNVFRGILEDAYEDVLKGKGEGYEDFMTYSKADKEPQSSRQLAATQLSSKQDKA